ncbi:hypothetical protein SAMN05192561_10693 [Halopenitus malekzadehii]|uniref:MarR family transcriptional regulator n=1 Tax=Halopenitus malekzadehii TaxID=1267564 RepID=A0A1H6J5F6_9EURY|nr:hypothetical protein [Halopenitus malekzadehii]SEH55506.1 hypothetical protein SAMN05192561_10693 [Halopenitus malekzadehii]
MPPIDAGDIETVVGLVADQPGSTAPELADLVAAEGIDPDRTNKLLQAGVRRGALIESRSTYWVVRDETGSPKNIDT